MELVDLGEKYIIKHFIRPLLPNDSGSIIGIGSDCCGLKIAKNKYLLLHTDRTPHNLIQLEYKIINHEDLGYYNVIQNFSDIAAAGGRLLGFLCAVSLPFNTKINILKRILKGIKRACENYNVDYLAGDLKESPILNIVGIAVGISNGVPLTRKGAKVGDVVAVTNNIGNYAAALLYTIYNIKYSKKIESEILIPFKKPSARINEGYWLRKTGYVTSCMDISDGLSASLNELSIESNVGMNINSEKIPLKKTTKKIANEINIDPLKMAISMGSDFELLFTVEKKFWKHVKTQFDLNNNSTITQIGQVTDTKKILFGDEKKDLTIKGWEHFRGYSLKEQIESILKSNF